MKLIKPPVKVFVRAIALWICVGSGLASAQTSSQTTSAVSAEDAKPALAAAQSANARPNFLIIISDDHAYQALSCYGSKINQTPNLDRLARSGMRFDRCCVTNSICGPSRAVMLTGKYSHLNGFRQNGDRFPGEQTTFPKLMQASGYQTALIGKWHLGSPPTGFDHWMILPDQGVYYNPDFITAEGPTKLPGYVTNLITDHAVQWLEQRQTTEPFMLMVQHKAPHREWSPAPEHLADFRDATFPEPATLFDDYRNRASVLAENEMEIGRHFRPQLDLKIWDPAAPSPAFEKGLLQRLDPTQRAAFEAAYRDENLRYLANPASGTEQTRYFYQRYLQDYLRCIASVDDSVGELLDYLDKNGLAENTVVVYASDQGFYLGEHGWYDKRWIFEESLRTPCLIRWPGATTAESSSSAIVSNLDFAETFLEIAGLPVPEDMQGQSLVPILQGATPADWRKSFYYHYYELDTHHVAAHEGVVTDRYKLIRYYQRLSADNQPEPIDLWDLMDRQRDPHEVYSYIDDPEYASIRTELTAELQRLRDKYKVDRP